MKEIYEPGVTGESSRVMEDEVAQVEPEASDVEGLQTTPDGWWVVPAEWFQNGE